MLNVVVVIAIVHYPAAEAKARDIYKLGYRFLRCC
jgi:hypothetical protein